MRDLSAIYTPGVIVRHPDRPEWGDGQVQSNIGGRITVNFPNEGKVVVDSRLVHLILVSLKQGDRHGERVGAHVCRPHINSYIRNSFTKG